MTVVLEAEAARRVPAIPQSAPHDDAAEAIEDIIAAHRAALVELAPHQEQRRVREETAWHITELGLLLRVRGTVHAACEAPRAHPALAGLRAGQPARVQAALAYREAGGDPVEEIMTLLPGRLDAARLTPHAKAPPGMVPNREGPRESTGTDRLTH